MPECYARSCKLSARPGQLTISCAVLVSAAWPLQMVETDGGIRAVDWVWCDAASGRAGAMVPLPADTQSVRGRGIEVIIAANWKMNPPLADAAALAVAYAADSFDGVTRILFPPAPYLVQMGVRLDGTDMLVGGQDCHHNASGAHTGDVAAGMLADCGARVVLLGHSERRADHGEDDALVATKAAAALSAGLDVMICVGETLDQRESGSAEAVVTAQLEGSVPAGIDASRLMLAYEPVWAIGTGKVAGVEEIAAMHAAIQQWLAKRDLASVPILYGGSVKPGNADAIFGVPDVGGALVGGASLKAEDFNGICSAGARAAAARS